MLQYQYDCRRACHMFIISIIYASSAVYGVFNFSIFDNPSFKKAPISTLSVYRQKQGFSLRRSVDRRSSS